MHILRKHTKDFWYFVDESRKKHAFEAARPRECCNTVSAKRTEIYRYADTKRWPVRNAWLFIVRFNSFNLWWSEHA